MVASILTTSFRDLTNAEQLVAENVTASTVKDKLHKIKPNAMLLQLVYQMQFPCCLDQPPTILVLSSNII